MASLLAVPDVPPEVSDAIISDMFGGLKPSVEAIATHRRLLGVSVESTQEATERVIERYNKLWHSTKQGVWRDSLYRSPVVHSVPDIYDSLVSVVLHEYRLQGAEQKPLQHKGSRVGTIYTFPQYTEFSIGSFPWAGLDLNMIAPKTGRLEDLFMPPFILVDHRARLAQHLSRLLKSNRMLTVSDGLAVYSAQVNEQAGAPWTFKEVFDEVAKVFPQRAGELYPQLVKAGEDFSGFKPEYTSSLQQFSIRLAQLKPKETRLEEALACVREQQYLTRNGAYPPDFGTCAYVAAALIESPGDVVANLLDRLAYWHQPLKSSKVLSTQRFGTLILESCRLKPFEGVILPWQARYLFGEEKYAALVGALSSSGLAKKPLDVEALVKAPEHVYFSFFGNIPSSVMSGSGNAEQQGVFHMGSFYQHFRRQGEKAVRRFDSAHPLA